MKPQTEIVTSNSQELTNTTLVADLRSIIEQGKRQAYAALNASMITTYWNVGKRIVEEEQHGEARAEYGKQLLVMLAKELRVDYGDNFSERNLRYYRQFYLYFNDLEIWNSRVPNLTWTHFRHLLRVDDEKVRLWYMNEASTQLWSTRELERNINTQYYHRLLANQKDKSEEVVDVNAEVSQEDKQLEFVKNPVVAEYLGLKPNRDFVESDLEDAIIKHIEKFLMELGKGYALVDRQMHIPTEKNDYYIDLVFYNYILQCFVLVDLKTEKITYEDVGQMGMYRKMFDQKYRPEGHNPTFGIILCADTDEDIARYSELNQNDHMFQAKYMLYMPSKEQLKLEIEREKEIYRLQCENPNKLTNHD
ncbi:MAG: PDDEXK nuclease domain-containing protein [Bacteroidaceae bacterium]|nr:PDDEXK nuclease domain-containing protein [Bacteroidaceae bacterium]